MNTLIVLLVIICLIAGVIWALRGNRKPAYRHKTIHRTSEGTDSAAPAKLWGLDKLENNPMFWGVEISQAGCEAAHALLGRQYILTKRRRNCHWQIAALPCAPASSRD